MTSDLARGTKRAEETLKKCLEEKEKNPKELQLEKPGSTIEDVSIVKSGQKTLNACEQEDVCRMQLEKAKNEQRTAQEARRAITENTIRFTLRQVQYVKRISSITKTSRGHWKVL